jgi:protein-tyrosine phosphatase
MTEQTKQYAAPVYEFIEPTTLWSEVLPGLFQGGTDDDDTLIDVYDLSSPRAITPGDFDTVITLYAYAAPVDWLVEELRIGIYDWNIEHIDLEMIEAGVTLAYKRWKSGKKVLIRCQAGINRSGLVMALVLMLDGMTADEAIELQRSVRSPSVLMNREFETWLRSPKAVDFVDSLRRQL